MRKLVISSICTAALLAITGCSMGPPGYIDDYATVGGKWERADPTYGRVGSPFSDPGTTDGYYAGGATIDEYAVEPYDATYDSEYDGQSKGGIVDGPVEAYPSDGGIEIVPQYEGESIILGEEW